jgi:hypothetical protein
MQFGRLELRSLPVARIEMKLKKAELRRER